MGVCYTIDTAAGSDARPGSVRTIQLIWLHPTHRLQRLLIQKKPNRMSLPFPPHSYLAMSAPLQHSLHRHLSHGYFPALWLHRLSLFILGNDQEPFALEGHEHREKAAP
jgi:hypothetical protein